ncbi:hypothetical protein WJX84_008465 [Apatococcus fuscideae]|uniref:Phosphodiesterase n=1 Tax=Apatococcus fuscideae TaxID=2026836 RepID=A0AAW1T1C6_9CHLO
MEAYSSAELTVTNDRNLLNEVEVPCWLHRPEPEGLRYNFIWANKAAKQRFGQPLAPDVQATLLEGYPAPAANFVRSVMHHLYDSVIVKGRQVERRMDLKKGMKIVFDDIKPNECVADLVTKPFRLKAEGKQIVVCLTQVLSSFEASSSEGIRSLILQQQSPIHSYLFDREGHLITANLKAKAWLESKGGLQSTSIKLQELFGSSGTTTGQHEAEAALQAIFVEKRPSHRVTLRSMKSSGMKKWTMYEMWPATDSVVPQQAMLVSTLNVTHQRQLEMQLEAAKEQLLRQNVQLEASKCKLEADQANLQMRLKQALKLAKAPRTHVDTQAVADKAIALLDMVLEGDAMDLKEVMAVRNAMVGTTDLRQPLNLGDQLLHKSGLSTEVGQAMIDLLQGDSHSGSKRLAKTHLSISLQRDSGMLTQDKKTGPSFDKSRRLSQDVSQKMCLPAGASGLEAGEMKPALCASASDQCRPEEQVTSAIVPVVERLLQEAGSSWNFSVFELADATDNRPLSTLGFYLLKGSGLIHTFHLNEEKLACFLRAIEAGYSDCPYHSRTHAAGVLQTMHMLSQHGLIQDGVLDSALQLAGYLAAIVHDFGHPGLTNDFLIRTRHQLATTYNDISPLENMHVSATFQLTYTNKDMEFMDRTPPEIRNMLRASLIELVLGTDMKKHFATLSRFQAVGPPAAAEALGASEGHPYATTLGLPGHGQPCGRGRLASLPADSKLLIAQIALKAADIGHLSSPTEVHKRWTTQLTEEFFRQGDRERAMDLKISPLMDRNDSAGMVKSQVGFLEIVALPLFKSLSALIPGTQPILDGVMANYEYWNGFQHT